VLSSLSFVVRRVPVPVIVDVDVDVDVDVAAMQVGSAELLSFGVSGMGVQATQSTPLLIGGSVMFGAVLGIFFLGEILELRGWVSVFLLEFCVGLLVLLDDNSCCCCPKLKWC